MSGLKKFLGLSEEHFRLVFTSFSQAFADAGDAIREDLSNQGYDDSEIAVVGSYAMITLAAAQLRNGQQPVDEVLMKIRAIWESLDGIEDIVRGDPS